MGDVTPSADRSRVTNPTGGLHPETATGGNRRRSHPARNPGTRRRRPTLPRPSSTRPLPAVLRDPGRVPAAHRSSGVTRRSGTPSCGCGRRRAVAVDGRLLLACCSRRDDARHHAVRVRWRSPGAASSQSSCRPVPDHAVLETSVGGRLLRPLDQRCDCLSDLAIPGVRSVGCFKRLLVI